MIIVVKIEIDIEVKEFLTPIRLTRSREPQLLVLATRFVIVDMTRRFLGGSAREN